TRAIAFGAALFASLALAPLASAQIRAQTIDPVGQQLSALSLKVDAAAAAAGRQVVAFHFSPEDQNQWSKSENTAPANEQRAQFLCQQLLGDRYGRALSRRARPNGETWYFS